MSLKIKETNLKIEFLNINGDPKLDPEIKPIKLSRDSKHKPPSYCLPWVEANRYTIQIKSNANYVIKKSRNTIEAWAEHGEKKSALNLLLDVPTGVSFVPLNVHEAMGKKISVGVSPAFSSPWQRQKGQSVTLKIGICWWTPPGWGLFFTSAVHRNPEFRVIEGFVRTDRWHRDIPIIIEPLVKEIHIKKFSVIANALIVPAEDIELKDVGGDLEKKKELIHQISRKRTRPSIYKDLVLGKKK